MRGYLSLGFLTYLMLGCQPAAPRLGADSSGMEIRFQDLMPDAKPGKQGELTLGGTLLPVQILSQKHDNLFEIDSLSHDVVVAKEVYQDRMDTFSLEAVGDEIMIPPIPVLRSPMKVGDSWTWQGHCIGQADHTAKATIASRSDKIYSGLSELESVVVEMDLQIEVPNSTAQRRFVFWFVPGKGLLKREFGSASVRQPLSQ